MRAARRADRRREAAGASRAKRRGAGTGSARGGPRCRAWGSGSWGTGDAPAGAPAGGATARGGGTGTPGRAGPGNAAAAGAPRRAAARGGAARGRPSRNAGGEREGEARGGKGAALERAARGRDGDAGGWTDAHAVSVHRLRGGEEEERGAAARHSYKTKNGSKESDGFYAHATGIFFFFRSVARGYAPRDFFALTQSGEVDQRIS
jgi:hypothetical protein